MHSLWVKRPLCAWFELRMMLARSEFPVYPPPLAAQQACIRVWADMGHPVRPRLVPENLPKSLEVIEASEGSSF